MTALTVLLEHPGSGVYRVPESTELAAIERVAASAGWRCVALDTTGIADRAGVLVAIKEAFGFPEWFGHNLDALVDALRDVTSEPGTVLVWSGAAMFAANDRQQYEKVLAVLRSRAAAGNPARFLTLLR